MLLETTIPFTNYMLFDNAIFVYYMRVEVKFLFNEMIGKGKGRVCKRSIDRTADNIYSEREGNYKSYAYFFCKKENFCLVHISLSFFLSLHPSLFL